MSNRRIALLVLIAATLVMALALTLLFFDRHAPRPSPKALAAAKKGMMTATAPKPKPKTVSILGFVSNVKPGTLLRPGQIGKIQVPADKMPKGAMPYSRAVEGRYYGSLLKVSGFGDRALMPDMVIRPGQSGFLTAVLKPGEQAITIRVDPVTDSAGLIWPGDHVDVLLLQSIPAVRLGHNLAIETVLHDVEIIATGSNLVRPNSVGQNTPTVTLEVTPQQAASLVLAEKLGALSLSVLSGRPAADPPSKPTWAYQVSSTIKALPRQDNITLFAGKNQQSVEVP